MLSSARLGGSICATGAALWRWLANFVAGAVFSASGCVFAWQGQHVAAVFRPDSLALIHTHSLSLRLIDFQPRLIRARAQAY